MHPRLFDSPIVGPEAFAKPTKCYLNIRCILAFVRLSLFCDCFDSHIPTFVLIHSQSPLPSSLLSIGASATMLRSQPARNTLRAVQRRQSICAPPSHPFSSTATVAGISPHRTNFQSPNTKSAQDLTKRGKSTAAATASTTYVLGRLIELLL